MASWKRNSAGMSYLHIVILSSANSLFADNVPPSKRKQPSAKIYVQNWTGWRWKLHLALEALGIDHSSRMIIPDLALPLLAYPGPLPPHLVLHLQHLRCHPCHPCHSHRRPTLSHGSVHTCARLRRQVLLPLALKLPVFLYLPGRRYPPSYPRLLPSSFPSNAYTH